MTIKSVAPKRNLFEIENARNLTREEVVGTFVPTKSFYRLLNSKNHIILGSRGSGKTVLAKMLSHDHLSLLNDDRTRNIVRSKSLIGLYVPLRIEWVGGLKNKQWQTDTEKEEFFRWRLNLATCYAFLSTFESCLNTYIDDAATRVLVERKVISEISKSLSDDEVNCLNIKNLRNYLKDIEFNKQRELNKARITNSSTVSDCGHVFDLELFTPLNRCIDLTNREFDFPDTTVWLVCLDEAEYLEESYHRILNSYMRTYSGNICFKITTMPYFHLTLDTNSAAPLNVGHDFEYIYIDQEPFTGVNGYKEMAYEFAVNLFSKRAEYSSNKFDEIRLRDFLGKSVLLDDKEDTEDSLPNFMQLVEQYCNPPTVTRARQLYGTPMFLDQIMRKLHGTLILKNAVNTTKGRKDLDVYSGISMIIRCSDGNPRHLVRIFNQLLLQTSWERDRGFRLGIKPLTAKTQTNVLISYASSLLNRIQSEKKVGHRLYDLLKDIGSNLSEDLHNKKIGTDQVSSISLDRRVDSETWDIVKYAVGIGLLFPNRNPNSPDIMPEIEGVFRLGYVFAPLFRIMPRRGKARHILSILGFKYKKVPAAASTQKHFDFIL